MSGISFSIGDSDKPGGTPKSSTPARKPGRPPASATKHRADVEAALSTMNSAYNLLSMGALLVRRPRTAAVIAGSAEQWQAGNREAFESSPKLASAIANAGQTSGIATFVITNAMAAFQIITALRAESADIAQVHAAETPPEG